MSISGLRVWVVNGMTESGDDWMFVFEKRPTDEEIELTIKNNDWLREEWEAECIQCWNVSEEEIL